MRLPDLFISVKKASRMKNTATYFPLSKDPRPLVYTRFFFTFRDKSYRGRVIDRATDRQLDRLMGLRSISFSIPFRTLSFFLIFLKAPGRSDQWRKWDVKSFPRRL